MPRNDNDAYYTHAGITKQLDILDIFGRDTYILEPCWGEGHMGKELIKLPTVSEVHGSDINGYSDQWLDKLTTLDATSPCYWQEVEYHQGNYDWVVTNPPFAQAFDILTQAYDHAKVGVAMVLRLSFLEPTQKRAEWLIKHSDNLRTVAVFGQPRPSFTPDNRHDSVTCAWFVWDKTFSWRECGLECPFLFFTDWKK